MFERSHEGDQAAEQEAPARLPKVRLWAYSFFAFLWLVALTSVADLALTKSAGWLFFWSASLALPNALLNAQRAHVRRADGLRHWRQGSWWHKFLSGASLRPVFHLGFATILIFGLLVHVAIEPGLIGPIVVTAVALPFSFVLANMSMRSSLKAPWLSFWPIGFGIGLAVAIALAVSIVFGSSTQSMPATLEAARAQYACYTGDSALMDVIFEFATFSAAIVNYGFALAPSAGSDWGTGLWVITLLAQSGLILIVAFSLAAFLLPSPQLRLGLRVVGLDPETPKDPSRRLLVQQTLSVAGLGAAGTWTIDKAEVLAVENRLPLLLRSGTMFIEQIDGGYYPEGTIASIETFEIQARALVKLAVSEADQEIATAFAKAQRGIEAYLDWHFSMKAEAARAMGLETMASGLTNKLGLAELYRKADVAIARLDGATKGLSMMDALVTDILKNRKIAPTSLRSRHILTTKRAELVPTLDKFLDPIPFKARVGVSGTVVAAGGLSGALLGRYIARKGAVRGAATVAGLSVGSVLPGIGTAAGALVGLVIGALADFSMLKYNEKVNRPKMRSQLQNALKQEEGRLRKALAGLWVEEKKYSKPQVELRCKNLAEKA